MSKSADFLLACENDRRGLLQALHPLRRLAETGIPSSSSDLAARGSSVLTGFADIIVEIAALLGLCVARRGYWDATFPNTPLKGKRRQRRRFMGT